MRTPKFQLGQTVTLKGQSVLMSVIAIIHVIRIDEIETIEYQLRNKDTLQLAQAFEQELSIWIHSGNGFPPDWFIKNNPTPPPRDKKSEDLMNMIRQASPDCSVPDPVTLMEKKGGDSNILEFKPSDSCKVGKTKPSEQDDNHKNFDYE